MFTGGQSRLQAAGRYLSGYGTSLIERFNQLARSPHEIPFFSSLINKVPGLRNINFGVVPSSGLKTFGKLAAKFGLAIPAAMMAYSTADHYVRKSQFFDNTILSEGITAGAATLWTKAQIGISALAEVTGGHTYREWQESIAPGSTEFSKLLAFPIMGALAGTTTGYLQRLGRIRELQKMGLPFEQATQGASLLGPLFKQELYGAEIPGALLAGAEGRTIDMVKSLARKKAAGPSGVLARRLPEWLGKSWTPTKLKTLIGAGIGAAVILPFLPGALVPSDRPEKLRAMYEGREKVPVKRGRWWEAGKTPWEGEGTKYFRFHWYPRMLARAKEKAIWGKDEPAPFMKFWIQNFTNELEEKHYYDRPYPMTAPAFQDVPFIGPLLSGTLGKIVKPEQLMHTKDWLKEGESGQPLYREMPPTFEEEDLSALGELEEGAPISPTSTKGIVGEQVYRLTEQIGLPGFTMTAIKEAITGTSDVFDQESQLATAYDIAGYEREWWEEERGGMMFTNEIYRRMFPHRRRQIPRYNPIPNMFSDVDWLPGPGERGPDLKHGDPYAAIPLGEERLPGAGYEVYYPELKGVAPENYPSIHRYAILADVAPYTEKYDIAFRQVKSDIEKGKLTSEQIEWFKTIQNEVKEKRQRKEFDPYLYSENRQTPIQDLLAAENDKAKAEGEGPSWFERTIGKYWETVAHGAEMPMEHLTPIAPAYKLIHMRTAVEDYQRTQLFGSLSGFWGHPIRDFIKPTITSTMAAIGIDSIPQEVQEKRDLHEYFDILKWVKYSRLRRTAQAEGDSEAFKEADEKRRETLFGINPYTMNFTHLYRSLPREERDYFKVFSEASLEERAEIYKMLPENERALMTARWQSSDAQDIQKAIKKGLLTEDQVEKANSVLSDLYTQKESEGMPKDKELWAEFVSSRLAGESYADWYRRTYLLAKALDGRNLPGPDWVAWHPQVSLDDVLLKVVENEGKNMYDYNLWPDRARRVARRPFIEEAAEELEQKMSSEDVRRRIVEILDVGGIHASHISITERTGGNNEVNLKIEEDRSNDVYRLGRRGLN